MCINEFKDMLYIKDQANVEWVAKVFIFLFIWILVMLCVVFWEKEATLWWLLGDYKNN
jgi:hypothetical protein